MIRQANSRLEFYSYTARIDNHMQQISCQLPAALLIWLCV